MYWDLAKNEKTFLPAKNVVSKVLHDFMTDATNRVNNSISDTEKTLIEAKEAIGEASGALNNSGDQAELNSQIAYQKVVNSLSKTKDQVAKLNYLELLNLDLIIKKINNDAKAVVVEANKEKGYYLKRTGDKIRNRDQRIGILFKYTIMGGVIAGIPGCIVGCLVEEIGRKPNARFSGWLIGAFVGILIGLLFAKGDMPNKIR